MWLSSDVQGECIAAVEGAENYGNKGAIKVTNAQIDQLILNAHISKLCDRTLAPFSHAPAHICIPRLQMKKAYSS